MRGWKCYEGNKYIHPTPHRKKTDVYTVWKRLSVPQILSLKVNETIHLNSVHISTLKLPIYV